MMPLYVLVKMLLQKAVKLIVQTIFQAFEHTAQVASRLFFLHHSYTPTLVRLIQKQREYLKKRRSEQLF